MTPRFLVAKYVKDLKRMEPRNFGVIVWSDGNVAARFAGEGESPLKPPAQLALRNKDAYRKWIGYWRRQIDAGSIETHRGDVAVTCPEFLDALMDESRGNFMLVDGGRILDKVDQGGLKELVDYLFSEVVTVKESGPPMARESERLAAGTTHVMSRAGLAKRIDLLHAWPGPCKIHGVLKSYDFDFAIGDIGDPDLVMHKVLLSHDKTFDSFMLNLDGFYSAKRRFDKDRVCTFVVPDGFGDPSRTKSNLAILTKRATIIDVSNEAEAELEIRKRAGMNGHR